MSAAKTWLERALGNSLFLKDEPVYATFLAGYFVAFTGYFVQMVGAVWLAWELSHSATWVGLVGFAELFPSLLFGVFASAYADRHNRFRIVIVTRVLAVLQSVLLFVLVYLSCIDIYMLVGLTFIAGTIIAFGSPPLFGIVPKLVRHENLHSAVSLNVTALNLAWLTGPIVGGFAIAGIGIAWLFFWNAVAYGIYLFCFWRIRHTFSLKAEKKPSTLFVADIIVGLKYMVESKGTRWLMLSVAVGEMLNRSVMYLLPTLSATRYESGAEVYSTLVSVAGFGGICGTLYIARKKSTAGLSDLVIQAVLILSVAILVIAVTQQVVFGVVGAWAVALANELRLASTTSLNQLAVPEELRSRVLGSQHLLGRASSALGVGVMGAVAGFMSLEVALVILAVIGLVFWLYLFSKRFQLRAQFTPT